MNDMYSPINFIERMDNMYPESYKKILPFVENMAESLNENQIYHMTNNDINGITREIIRKGNLHENLPSTYHGNTIHDIVKALLLKELSERHRRRPDFYSHSHHNVHNHPMYPDHNQKPPHNIHYGKEYSHY